MEINLKNREQSAGPMLNESFFRERYAFQADIIIGRYVFAGTPVVLLYCDGMADARQLNQFVLPQLEQMLENDTFNPLQENKTLQLMPFDLMQGFVKLDSLLYSGYLLLILENRQFILTLDLSNPPKRDPEESAIEVSIKGPRDGFTEDIGTNTALIRKRIKSSSLCYEKLTIGSKSMTKVAFLYVSDAANPSIVAAARSRLQSMQTESLISGEQLEEALADSPYALMPLADHSGRPDFVAESLLRGRVAMLVEGYPFAVIAPASLTSMLKSPEDLHLPFYIVAIQRLLRLISLIVTTLLPGFWVATSSFQMDQIPFPLLATITSARIGIPLPGPIDLFLMLTLFELFREAGVRLPKAVGQTVTVVGGLFVGDAAINAGLTSPTTLIVSAITLVSSFTLVNQSFTGAVTLVRLFILIFSSLVGMYGFFLSLFAVFLYLATLESLGVPFLDPISPFNAHKIVLALLIKPWHLLRNRPAAVSQDKPRRDGGKS